MKPNWSWRASNGRRECKRRTRLSRDERRRRGRSLVVELLESREMLDTTGPRLVSLTPAESGNVGFSYLDVTFNEAIDFGTISSADVQLTTPSGSLVTRCAVDKMDVSDLSLFPFALLPCRCSEQHFESCSLKVLIIRERLAEPRPTHHLE